MSKYLEIVLGKLREATFSKPDFLKKINVNLARRRSTVNVSHIHVTPQVAAQRRD